MGCSAAGLRSASPRLTVGQHQVDDRAPPLSPPPPPPQPLAEGKSLLLVAPVPVGETRLRASEAQRAAGTPFRLNHRSQATKAEAGEPVSRLSPTKPNEFFDSKLWVAFHEILLCFFRILVLNRWFFSILLHVIVVVCTPLQNISFPCTGFATKVCCTPLQNVLMPSGLWCGGGDPCRHGTTPVALPPPPWVVRIPSHPLQPQTVPSAFTVPICSAQHRTAHPNKCPMPLTPKHAPMALLLHAHLSAAHA